MAGSFGGFFKDTSFPDNIYGITAAQCVPGGDIGSPVCSPSTVELNIRLKRLLPHTSLCPPTQQRKFNDAKDTEAKSLLQRFRFLEEDSGTTLRSPTFQFPGRTGILLGRPVGRIVSCELGTCEQGLYRYDQKLAANNHEIFAAMCSWKTTMDWSIFSIDAARYGGNIYDGEIIEETGFLYPGAHVEKIGRSTGPQDGVVNGYFLQRWHSSQSTHEIAIVSNGGAFAELGDAGGCVFEKSNEGNKAAGIVIGTNRRDDFTLATPLDLILTSAPQYTWA
ncbi:hypothetical protein HOY80DRAFT_946694 [Tuber brumale]|nr:hypothetical protein HOY80DRAFT_946694 [Tuber brumale]